MIIIQEPGHADFYPCLARIRGFVLDDFDRDLGPGLALRVPRGVEVELAAEVDAPECPLPQLVDHHVPAAPKACDGIRDQRARVGEVERISFVIIGKSLQHGKNHGMAASRLVALTSRLQLSGFFRGPARRAHGQLDWIRCCRVHRSIRLLPAA